MNKRGTRIQVLNRLNILVKPKRSDFDFEWLFAIVAGIAILILAVYGATRIGQTARYQTDTEVAQKISIITDPLQAGFTSGQFGEISFQQDTKISNNCYSDGFGRNDISVQTRSQLGKPWQEGGGAVSVHDKYIFSEFNGVGAGDTVSRDFYVFSKPFNFPYKVADLLFITNKKYCFVEPPKELEDEILGLKMANVETGTKENCSSDSIQVCFGSQCDISVYGTCTGTNCNLYDNGYVDKNGERYFYAGSLLYAAIFSDKDVYDCNVQRLLYRTSRIADVLLKKAALMNARECSTNLQGDLVSFYTYTSNATTSDIVSLDNVAKELDTKDNTELCKLW